MAPVIGRALRAHWLWHQASARAEDQRLSLSNISTDDSDWVAALRYYHGKRPGVRQRVGQSFSGLKMRRMAGLAAYGIVVVNVLALTILVIMQRYG